MRRGAVRPHPPVRPERIPGETRQGICPFGCTVDQNTYSIATNKCFPPQSLQDFFLIEAMSFWNGSSQSWLWENQLRHCYASEIYHRPQNCKITRDLKRCQELIRSPSSPHIMSTQKLPGATIALASWLGADPCWFLASLCSSSTSPPPIVRDDDWHDDTSFKTQTLLLSMILVVSESAAWRKRMFATPWLAMALHFLFCKVFKKKVFWSNQRFCLRKFCVGRHLL